MTDVRDETGRELASKVRALAGWALTREVDEIERALESHLDAQATRIATLEAEIERLRTELGRSTDRLECEYDDDEIIGQIARNRAALTPTPDPETTHAD